MEIPLWLEQSKYLAVFVMTMVEGPVTSMTGGFLVHLGQMDLARMYFSAVGGDLLADIIWYFVGYHGASRALRRYGHFVGFTPEAMDKAKVLFHRYHVKILLISKLTMGFGFSLVTLITAGTLKIPFKTYVLLNLFGGLIWIGLLVTIGYLFGNIVEQIPEQYRIVSVLGGLLVAISFFFFAQRKLRSIEL